MNAELVERVARAIHSPRYDNTGDYPLPIDFHTAGRVLAALGLDDLDVAVERGAHALCRFETGSASASVDESDLEGVRAVLEAVLTPEKP
jgi:hypothetical protein